MDRRTLFTDIDDTLICSDLSKFPCSEHITIESNGRKFIAVPHRYNINLLKKFYNLGYDVYAWSKTGKTWARDVCTALNIDSYVTDFMSKPDFILDDKPVEYWMGTRCYRDPHTGQSIDS